MTEHQIIALVIVSVLAWPVVGLGGYTFGWWWRGRHEADRLRFKFRRAQYTGHDRPMTTEERAAFDEAFAHMDKAFDAVGRVFGR